MSQPILTQDEIKEYVTRTLLAFHWDLRREMQVSGEPPKITDDFYARLYELTRRFELEPDQQALVCGLKVCLLYDPPAESLVVRLPATGLLAAQPAITLN